MPRAARPERPGSPGRRPLTRVAVVGTAAHVFFELAAGVGMPFASVLGAGPSTGLWAAGTIGLWRGASRRSARSDVGFAIVDGLALAAVVGHLAAWPSRPTRTGLPWLRDCEGLGSELMPYYNPILYASGAAALLALVRENPRAPAAVPLACVGLAPVLAAAQHAEFRRLTDQAADRPRWWNRRLRR